MKKYMAIYIGTADLMREWEALSEQEQKDTMQKGLDEWSKWSEAHNAVIMDNGHPLGSTRKIDNKGVSESQNSICGYTIVEAESHENAAELFLNHPHFTIFPGDSVEVMECMPVPSSN